MKTVSFQITTDASGDYDSSTDGGVTGQGSPGSPYLLYGVQWVDGDLADGVDAVLSVTNAPGGVDTTLLTMSNANTDDWYYPRTIAQDVNGADWEDGTDLTAERVMHIVDGQLKLVVADGGDTKTGKCLVYLKCL